MSIKADVQELDRIRLELKRLSSKRKSLKQQEQIVEARISEYLKSKDLPGVKHQGTAIILEEKEKFSRKKKKEGDSDVMDVLKKHGIEDPEKVMAEMVEARKGDSVSQSKLKIQKYKGGQIL